MLSLVFRKVRNSSSARFSSRSVECEVQGKYKSKFVEGCGSQPETYVSRLVNAIESLDYLL